MGTVSGQSVSRVRLFVNPWTAASQGSLSIINSLRLLKLMSIKSLMTSSHLILCHPLLLPPSIFPSIPSGGQSIGVSASASVFPMNIQDSFPLGLTGLISLQSKGLSRVFSFSSLLKNSSQEFRSINSLAFSLLYGPALTSIHDYWKNQT